MYRRTCPRTALKVPGNWNISKTAAQWLVSLHTDIKVRDTLEYRQCIEPSPILGPNLQWHIMLNISGNLCPRSDKMSFALSKLIQS